MNLQLTETGMKFYGVTSNVLKRDEDNDPYFPYHIVINKENSTAIAFTIEDIKTLLDIGFIEIKKD